MPKPLTKERLQELKDKLWRLDEEAGYLAARVTDLTGRAWKSAVESENWRRDLIAAHNEARSLAERIEAVMDDTETYL